MKPRIMSYRDWHTRIRADIARNPHLSAVDRALKQYADAPNQASLESLKVVLQNWRRDWPLGTVSMGDPMESLYDQVMAVSRMPWGDPAVLRDRIAYETRVRLLYMFSDLSISTSIVADAFSILTTGVRIGLQSAGQQDVMNAPLTGTGVPAYMATRTYDNTYAATGDVAGHIYKGFQENHHARKRHGKDAHRIADDADRKALAAIIEDWVRAAWQYVSGVFKEAGTSILDSVEHSLLENDLSDLSLEISNYAQAYLFRGMDPWQTPIVDVLKSARNMVGHLKTAYAKRMRAWRAKIDGTLQRRMVSGVYTGVWLQTTNEFLNTLAHGVAIPLQYINENGMVLGRMLWSVLNAIGTIVWRYWERYQVKALRAEARKYLAQGGYTASPVIDVTAVHPGSLAARPHDFDKWFLGYVKRSPAVAALVFRENMCEPISFFDVLDARGELRYEHYTDAHEAVTRLKVISTGYLHRIGLRAHRRQGPLAISGEWDVPLDVRLRGFVEPPPLPDLRKVRRERAQYLENRATWASMR
jgi:hypothetical protein